VIVQYAETLRSLTEAAQPNSSPESQRELSEELERCVKEITPVLSLAYLYATPMAIRAVEHLFSANEKLLNLNTGDAPAKLDLPGMYQAERFARMVGLDFAREFRLHLGLEALPGAAIDTGNRGMLGLRK